MFDYASVQDRSYLYFPKMKTAVIIKLLLYLTIYTFSTAPSTLQVLTVPLSVFFHPYFHTTEDRISLMSDVHEAYSVFIPQVKPAH